MQSRDFQFTLPFHPDYQNDASNTTLILRAALDASHFILPALDSAERRE